MSTTPPERNDTFNQILPTREWENSMIHEVDKCTHMQVAASLLGVYDSRENRASGLLSLRATPALAQAPDERLTGTTDTDPFNADGVPEWQYGFHNARVWGGRKHKEKRTATGF